MDSNDHAGQNEDLGIVVTGVDLEDALKSAAGQLGLDRNSMEYRVIDSGAGGIFGLLGKKKITIRAWEADSQRALRDAIEFLSEILRKMKIGARVEGVEDEDGLNLNIRGESEGLVIGRRGQTLDALQYITNRYIQRIHEGRIRVVIDSEGYRSRREQSIRKIAISLGKKAKRLGKPVAAEPMGSVERRLFHLALKTDKELKTESRGEGEKRKVIIYPVKR
ncbi:MAG: KH domain-containing protein [Deltaproteobacteria bacterium]|uniref:RNA-binding protein KhpB n=1 Tax=Candidatus Zymogenus saltonus TaxID=2844893 RepID=A0A9D8KG41_9DELT|nr:KH domain-containing protein [Candidatus Zymogenus saltonus]